MNIFCILVVLGWYICDLLRQNPDKVGVLLWRYRLFTDWTRKYQFLVFSENGFIGHRTIMSKSFVVTFVHKTAEFSVCYTLLCFESVKFGLIFTLFFRPYTAVYNHRTLACLASPEKSLLRSVISFYFIHRNRSPSLDEPNKQTYQKVAVWPMKTKQA